MQKICDRRKSEDAGEQPLSPLLTPQRHMSMDVGPELKPQRKNSRYDWATEGEGEMDPPEVFQELLPYASLTEPEAPVPLSRLVCRAFGASDCSGQSRQMAVGRGGHDPEPDEFFLHQARGESHALPRPCFEGRRGRTDAVLSQVHVM